MGQTYTEQTSPRQTSTGQTSYDRFAYLRGLTKMTKEKLAEELIQHLERFPEDSPAFLEVISVGLESYKSKVNKMRDFNTAKAIQWVMSPKLVRATNWHFLLPIMHVHYPEGNNERFSPNEKETWIAFIQKMKKAKDYNPSLFTSNEPLDDWCRTYVHPEVIKE